MDFPKLFCFIIIMNFTVALIAQEADSLDMYPVLSDDENEAPAVDLDAEFYDDYDHSLGYGMRVNEVDIKKHLEILASDEMEGRETGMPGQERAAEYIAGYFKTIGLQPTPSGTYYQDISFTRSSWVDIFLNVNGEKKRFLWDYYAFTSSNESIDTIQSNEVVFLGYGIDDTEYSDYEGVDVKGKIILVYQGEPMNRKGKSFITNNNTYSVWTMDWRKKLETAKRKGVKAIIFIEPKVDQRVSQYRDQLLQGQLMMGDRSEELSNFTNSVYVSKNVAKDIIGNKYYKKVIKARDKILKSGKPQHVVLPSTVRMGFKKKDKLTTGNNVLGFLEGSDPELKDEIVVVSAHYDHLGMRGDDIYNGADDNGSGTSTVLDIAEAFRKAEKDGKGPRRSILFILVSGEEKGLLGSKYYVNFPVYPLDKTIVDVNVDMIGRVDKKHEGNPNYIYVIGADRLSTELHDINENMNKKYTQLELDYTFNEEDDPNRYYYRSDHYNFAERGIPSIFYFSGVHADYHRTSDTVEKIDFEKTATIGKLIFHTIWQLSNQDKTIEVNVGK